MSNNKREYTEMTADAKVGLLLGLVFIAIIAFVFNGLPDFVQSTGEKPVVETAVTTQTSGNLVIEPAVVDVARSLQEKRTTVRYVDPPVDTTVLDGYAGGSKPTQEPTTSVEKAPVAAKTQESTSPLTNPTTATAPKIAEPILTPKQPDNVVVSKTQEKPAPGLNHVVAEGESLGEIARKYYGDQEGNKLSTIQMLYEANKTILESPDSIRVGDQLVIPKIKSSAAPEQAVQAQKETSAGTLLDKFKNVFTTSVEKKTETPAKNSEVVDKKTTSKPQVSVADKTPLPKPVVDKTALLKPVADKTALPKPVADKTSLLKADKIQPAKTDRSQQSDKVQPVKVDKSQSVKGVTEYTIQSGDYLYKIAQKQLGDGERYTEILRLNSELSEKDRLKVGTKLKIPKK
jgi:nucleoid-associated protein YgaU